MKFVAVLAALAAVADAAATTVAVLEFGKQGSVRRTTSTQTHTTVNGVHSFWRLLSGQKGLQQPGMTVVPDLFNRPDGVAVLGISGAGVDLEAMPNLANLVLNEDKHVVGHMTLTGSHERQLLNRMGPSKFVDAEAMVEGVKAEASSTKLSSVSIKVDSENAAAVDAEIGAMLKAMQEHAGDNSNIIVHLVVEEEEGAARRRLSTRRLEEDNQDGNNNGDQQADGNGNNQNGYYIYGYYQNGEWVTPYKTMFQIQYFNIVLWTSLGLFVILFYVIYKVIDMPLEADTLLFGESAKMLGGD